MNTVPCLICYRLCNPHSNGGNKHKEKLSSQLGTIFLLRNVLKLPKLFCANLLARRGNPSEWVASCKKCSKLLSKVQKICQQMISLEKEFGCIKNTIKIALQNSKNIPGYAEMKPGTDVIRMFEAGEEIRSFILNGTFTKEPKETSTTINCEKEIPEHPAILPLDELQIKCENDNGMEMPVENSKNICKCYGDENISELPNDGNIQLELDNTAEKIRKQTEVQDGQCTKKQRVTRKRKANVSYAAISGSKNIPFESDSEMSIKDNGNDSEWEMSNDSDTESESPIGCGFEEAISDNNNGSQDSGVQNKTLYINKTVPMKKTKRTKAVNIETEKGEWENNEDRSHCKKRRIRKDKPQTCEVCQSVFETYNSYRTHFRRAHTEDFTYVCDICEKGFWMKKEMLRHQKNAHPDLFPKKKKCQYCSKSFFGKHIAAHVANLHTNELKHFCPVCNVGFTEKRKLDAHKINLHNAEKPHKCRFCPKSFRQVGPKRNHEIAAHTKEYQHICEICGKGYSTQISLKTHLAAHASAGAKTFACELCGLDFWFSSNFKEHQRGWHYQELGLEPLKCITCDKIFKQSSTLKLHQKREHEKDFTPCSICGHQFVDLYRLKRHIATVHNGELRYHCEFCPEKFATTRQLHAHKQLHTGYKFQCNLCTKGFTNSSNLNAHLEVHSRNGQPKKRKRITLQ